MPKTEDGFRADIPRLIQVIITRKHLNIHVNLVRLWLDFELGKLC